MRIRRATMTLNRRVFGPPVSDIILTRRPSSCNTRWVDYRRGLFCTVACAPVERRAFWWWAIVKQCVSDCVSTFTLSFRHLHLYLLLEWLWWGSPIQLWAIHLLAYFASCSLPNINTVKLYCTFITLPCFAVSMWSNSAPMSVDACRCGQCGN